MSAQVFLSLIVPAYNEAERILDTLADFRAYLDRQSFSYELLVSADGTDGTRDLVADLALTDARIQVMGTPERGGKGRGIRRAVAVAQGRYIGFVDADNKTPLDQFDKVLPFLEGGYDIVMGSRGLPDSQIEKRQPWYRQAGSRAFWLVMRMVVGLPGIRDTQCGFKFFRGDVARDLFARQCIDGYMFDVEILYLAHQSGCRIREVGVRWRDDGDSRLGLVRGNIRNAMDILRIRFGRSSAAPRRQDQSERRLAA